MLLLKRLLLLTVLGNGHGACNYIIFPLLFNVENSLSIDGSSLFLLRDSQRLGNDGILLALWDSYWLRQDRLNNWCFRLFLFLILMLLHVVESVLEHISDGVQLVGEIVTRLVALDLIGGCVFILLHSGTS